MISTSQSSPLLAGGGFLGEGIKDLPNILKELCREQRRHGAQCVSHQTLACNRRTGALAITIGRVAVRTLKHKVNTKRNQHEANARADPVHKLVLRKAVDEQTNRQPDRTVHGTIQTRLGVHDRVGIRGELVVLAHLEVVRAPGEGGAEGETNVGEASDTLGPAALVGKSDGDDGEEQEGDGPAESDPEAKRHDNGLGEEHLDGLNGTGLQHGLEIGGVDVSLGHVALVTGSFAQLHGALVQRDTTARLREEEKDANEQRDVGNTLDTLDPAPANALVDESGINGRSNGAEDGDPREHGHGARALVRDVHVVKGAADENGADAAKDTEEQPQADDGTNGLAEGEADEEQVEAEESAGVDDFATDELAEGCEDHGCERAGEVEGEETHLAELG